MTRIPGIAIIALGLFACDSPSPADPNPPASARAAMAEKLPEGTEVMVAFLASEVPEGTVFIVQGAGNSEGAFCVVDPETRLYEHEITLVGGGSDPEGMRFVNFTFSNSMPPGTQFQITGRYTAMPYCGGGYSIFRAIVINGSAN